MNLAYVADPAAGGAFDAAFVSEVRAVAAMSHDVTIFSSRTLLPRRGKAIPAQVVALAPFGIRTMALACSAAMRQPASVARAAHRAVSGTRGRDRLRALAALPHALAIASVAASRHVEHVHALRISAGSDIARIVAHFARIPWSCSAPAGDRSAGGLRERLDGASFVRVASEDARRDFLERAGNEMSSHCRVIRSGVDIPTGRAGRTRRAVRLFCPSLPESQSGRDHLLRALTLLSRHRIPFQCDVASEAAATDGVRAAIVRAGLASYAFACGNMPHDIVLSRLQRGFYDVVVFPSIAEATDIPAPLIEAMAAGIPCIAVRTGAVGELIDDPRCSRIVPQGDSPALAAAVAAFAFDAVRRSDVGARARQRVCDAFDIRVSAREFCRTIGAVGAA